LGFKGLILLRETFLYRLCINAASTTNLIKWVAVLNGIQSPRSMTMSERNDTLRLCVRSTVSDNQSRLRFYLFDIAVARNHDILRAVQLMPFRYMGYDYDNRFSRCH